MNLFQPTQCPCAALWLAYLDEINPGVKERFVPLFHWVLLGCRRNINFKQIIYVFNKLKLIVSTVTLMFSFIRVEQTVASSASIR